VSAVRGKRWKEAVEFCKVLIPGNDENRGNLSEGSQPENWTQSYSSMCRLERSSRGNFVDKIELLLSVPCCYQYRDTVSDG